MHQLESALTSLSAKVRGSGDEVGVGADGVDMYGVLTGHTITRGQPTNSTTTAVVKSCTRIYIEDQQAIVTASRLDTQNEIVNRLQTDV